MDKAIAEKIAKNYIIESMAKGLNLTLHEGPDFPTGYGDSTPLISIYSPTLQVFLPVSDALTILLYLRAPAR